MKPNRLRFRRLFAPTLLAAMAVPLILASPGPAQTPDALVLSLAKGGEFASGRYLPPGPADLLGLVPGTASMTHPHFSRQSLDVFVGDVNRNGAFDDAPANIDAIAILPGSKRPSIYDVILSFSAASTQLEGDKVLDGDLVQLVPGGGFDMVAAEGTLASVTGTRTVDVDAATVTAAGELIWSFADDEATTSTLLAKQYGGTTLHDEAVLGWKLGTAQLRVVLTKADVIKLVSKATGKTLTSVVDLTGLALDPANTGELLFTLGSTAKGLEGAVFTTAGGGAYATLNKTRLDGSSPFGLKSTPSIDALAVYSGGATPLVIEAAPERVVTPSTTGLDIRLHGATPRQRLQLFVTYAERPAPRPFKLPAPITGAGHGYVALTDPLLPLCPQLPILQPMADANGDAVVQLPIGAVPPGVTFVMQAVDLTTLEVSEPVAVDLVAK